jgi:hypothetical protein
MSHPRFWFRGISAHGKQIALGGAIALAAMAITPVLTHADVSGGCTAQATETSADGKVLSTIDITKQSEWHVHKDSTLSGTGHAKTEQHEGSASAAAFGFGVWTIAEGKGKGQDGAGSIALSKVASFVREIGVIGSSTSCDGSLVIIIDDQNPVTTVAGAVGLGSGLLGLAGLAGVGLRRIKV